MSGNPLPGYPSTRASLHEFWTDLVPLSCPMDRSPSFLFSPAFRNHF